MKITEYQAIIAGLIVLAAAVSTALIIDTVLIHNKEETIHGTVSSSSAMCSEFGRRIMKEGGSAVDAAITTSLCVGVVNSHSSGIGGDGFIMIRDKSGKVKVFDARATAPAAAKQAMFKNRNQSKIGGLAVAVPGYLKGIHAVQMQYGRLSWTRLFRDIIKLCDEGVEISPAMAKVMRTKLHFKDVSSYESLASVYTTNETDTCCFKKEGTVVKLEKLAETLSVIASQGIDPFYKGELAENMVETIHKNGGIMTLKDLENYRIKIKEPVHVTIGGKDLYSVPLPSISSFIFVVLKVMEKFKLQPKDFNKAETYRKILETFRYTYTGIENFGDESKEVEEELTRVLSDEFINEVYDKVKNGTVNVGLVASSSKLPDDSVGTSHVSVIHSNGQAVSITTSINRWFGSLLMTDDGIILNDLMDDFTFPSESPDMKNNYPLPGRRPRSGMSPIIMTDKALGKIWSIGGTNGTRIVTGVAYVLINIIFRGLSLKDSIEEARLHVLSRPNVFYESKFDAKIVDELEKMGYNATFSNEAVNIVNGASYSPDGSEAWGDSRKFGAGYTF